MGTTVTAEGVACRRTPAEDIGNFYRENGFVVLRDALSPRRVQELNQETTAICRGDHGPIPGPDGDIAPASPDEPDNEVLRRFLCVHFPHKVSEVMLRAMAYPSIVRVLTAVIGPNVKCMQSMLFIKAAGKPGQAWHQDEYYIPTRDRSLAGGWIALDDASTENGCLWVIPGSHRHGVLWPQHEHNDRRFDCAGESWRYPYSDGDGIPVEVPAGALVVFNGYLLHRSLPNRAKAGYRRALVNHYMSAESLLPWAPPKEGEYMAQADTRDFEIVAGEDPYPWKGKEDIQQASVRIGGQGGCQTEFS